MILFMSVLDQVALLFYSGLGYWDICSGHCICNELGGGGLYLNGKEILYDTLNNTEFLGNLIVMSPNILKLNKCIKLFENTEY